MFDNTNIGCLNSSPIPQVGHNSQAPHPFSQSVAVNTFDLNKLAADASKRIAESVNRSGGQHIRAMREQHKQTETLHMLYALGCKYDITNGDMRSLAAAVGIDFNTLQNFSG